MGLDETYQALADPSRRAILTQLAEGGPRSVGDLAEPLSIGLPTVSKHLDVLARAGLVERAKVGRTVTVTLRPGPMADAMAWLEAMKTFWAARIERLADLVEKEER